MKRRRSQLGPYWKWRRRDEIAQGVLAVVAVITAVLWVLWIAGWSP